MRTARVERKTKESHVLVEINLDGQGIIDVATRVPFFDHMMSQLGKHSGFDLTVKTTGDVEVILTTALKIRHWHLDRLYVKRWGIRPAFVVLVTPWFHSMKF